MVLEEARVHECMCVCFFFQWTFWRVSKLNEMSLALVMLELNFFFYRLWRKNTGIRELLLLLQCVCVCCFEVLRLE